MKLSRVAQLAIAVRRIAAEEYTSLDYKRVYIPKEFGKWRPLGVPKPAYRIYLHMLNQVLVKFLDQGGHLHEAQHGFRPNRGTMTA